jgi:hypothetical protein
MDAGFRRHDDKKKIAGVLRCDSPAPQGAREELFDGGGAP